MARPRIKRSGHALIILEQSESAALPSAQNLEASERTARLHRLIVSPDEDCERQSLGRFLPRAFAGENAIADLHAELVGIVGVSGGDVGLDISQVLFRFGDLPRQIANLPADMALLIGMNGAQLVELADFRIDLDLSQRRQDCRMRSP